MSILTIQNVLHNKIKLPFSVQHRKQLLSELVLLEGFIPFMNFLFKSLPIDIIHHTRISSSREKMKQNKKELILASISFLLLNRLCLKSSPEHIIKGQSPSDPTLFIFVRNIAQCPQNPTIFIIFVRKYCPGPHYIWFRLPQTPLYFIFLDKKFCPGPSSPSCYFKLNSVDTLLVTLMSKRVGPYWVAHRPSPGD